MSTKKGCWSAALLANGLMDICLSCCSKLIVPVFGIETDKNFQYRKMSEHRKKNDDENSRLVFGHALAFFE